MPKCLAAARMVVWCSMMYTANSRALCSMLSRITHTSHHRSRKVYGCPRAVMTRQTGIMCSFRSKTPESFYLQGSGAMFKRRKPQSRVWGRHSPTSFPRGAKPAGFGEGTPQQVSREGQNRRIADFGTVVETCSKTAADCPCSGFSVHKANRAGLSARCTRPFFLSAKDTFQRPPATRGTGIFQRQHRTIVSAAFAQSFAPSVQL